MIIIMIIIVIIISNVIVTIIVIIILIIIVIIIVIVIILIMMLQIVMKMMTIMVITMMVLMMLMVLKMVMRDHSVCKTAACSYWFPESSKQGRAQSSGISFVLVSHCKLSKRPDLHCPSSKGTQCLHFAHFALLRWRLAGQTFNFDWSDLSTLLSTTISIPVDVKVEVVN